MRATLFHLLTANSGLMEAVNIAVMYYSATGACGRW
jgi:hypothetical protein